MDGDLNDFMKEYLKAISDFNKKKRESTKTSVVEKAETKVVKENNNKENIHENIGYEQEH